MWYRTQGGKILIEKLQAGEGRPTVINAKINELIDEHNKLDELFHGHYHICSNAGDNSSYLQIDVKKVGEDATTTG